MRQCAEARPDQRARSILSVRPAPACDTDCMHAVCTIVMCCTGARTPPCLNSTIILDYAQASGTCTSPLNKSQNVAAIIIISTTSVALSVSISATIPSSARALCFFRGGYALRVAAAADLPGGRSTGCVRARSG